MGFARSHRLKLVIKPAHGLKGFDNDLNIDDFFLSEVMRFRFENIKIKYGFRPRQVFPELNPESPVEFGILGDHSHCINIIVITYEQRAVAMK